MCFDIPIPRDIPKTMHLLLPLTTPCLLLYLLGTGHLCSPVQSFFGTKLLSLFWWLTNVVEIVRGERFNFFEVPFERIGLCPPCKLSAQLLEFNNSYISRLETAPCFMYIRRTTACGGVSTALAVYEYVESVKLSATPTFTTYTMGHILYAGPVSKIFSAICVQNLVRILFEDIIFVASLPSSSTLLSFHNHHSRSSNTTKSSSTNEQLN